jgi:hypothetical protein
VRGSILGDFPEIFRPELKGGPFRERGSKDLGEWSLVVRSVAEWDFDRIPRLLSWPLRDLFLAYLAILKRDAIARYHHDLMIWAVLAPHRKESTKPPRLPRILDS